MSLQQNDDFQEFFRFLSYLFDTCEVTEDFASVEDIEVCQDGLRNAVNTLYFIKSNSTFEENATEELKETLLYLINCIISLKEKWDNIQPYFISCSKINTVLGAGEVERTGCVGRPAAYKNPTQVSYLLSYGFSWTEIANIFLVHRTTLWRRMKNVVNFEKYSNITDEQLTCAMRNIHENHPHSGVAVMLGHLRSLGIVVQHHRVRQTLRNIDPSISTLRWGLVTQRRQYRVPTPNYLWHMDGHHKLVRWKMVTHGCIDGFSRLIVYLHCSNNNQADTVLGLFLQAVENYSLPLKVRGDRGSENVGVANFMQEHHRHFIWGSSVHNSRIERLWRDVFYSVIKTFYSLFSYMETVNILNVENEVDMQCLHHVFLPRINNALAEFRNAYNNHGMQTEKNWSPLKMWINGMIARLRNSPSNILPAFNEPNDFDGGVDPNLRQAEVLQVDEDLQELAGGPQIQTLDVNLNEQYPFTELVNPLDRSDNLGIDLYIQSKHMLTVFLQH